MTVQKPGLIYSARMALFRLSWKVARRLVGPRRADFSGPTRRTLDRLLKPLCPRLPERPWSELECDYGEGASAERLKRVRRGDPEAVAWYRAELRGPAEQALFERPFAPLYSEWCAARRADGRMA